MGGERSLYAFSPDSRTVFGNNIACAFLPAVEYETRVRSSQGQMPSERDLGHFDLDSMAFSTVAPCPRFPLDLPAAEPSAIPHPFGANPWNDLCILQDDVGDGLLSEIVVYDRSSGELACNYAVPGDRPCGSVLAWVGEQQILLLRNGLLGTLDVSSSVFLPAPGGCQEWTACTRLPDRTWIYSRDGGETLEHGNVDWLDFHIAWSDTVAYLGSSPGRLFAPIGNSAVLVGCSWGRGDLHLIDLEEYPTDRD